MQVAPVEVLPVLFGRNFVRCLVNQLASPERYLHRIAEKSIKVIHSRALDLPGLTSIVIDELMITNGYINFDTITKTKTIEKLISQTPLDTVQTIVPNFDQMILHPQSTDEKVASARRQIIADYQLTIIRSKSIQDKIGSTASDYDKVALQIFALLAKHAYFEFQEDPNDPRSAPEPPISRASREMFRSRIVSSLTYLTAKTADDLSYPYKLISIVQRRESLTNSKLVTLDIDGSIHKKIRRAWKVLEKIRGKREAADTSKKDVFNAFELLYCLTMIQVYNGDADAVNMLDELQDCYKALLKHENGDAQKEGSEMLVEILLSLLSKSSLLFRRLAQQVFAVCTSTITADGLRSMIRVSTHSSKSFPVGCLYSTVQVLETNESVTGQTEIFEPTNLDEGNVNMSDGGEVSLDGDADANGSKDSETGGSSGSEEEDGGDDSEGTDDELAAFDAKLAQALGTRKGNEDFAASDGDESSDEDMDDEQMEALDEHLEKVFRERKKVASKKTEKRDAKETVVLFKSRVLELLEIYIKQQYSKQLALDLIMPLLTLIHTTTSKPVSEKACSLIREYSKVLKLKYHIYFPDNLTLLDLLGRIHKAATKDGSNAYGTACSQASILVSKFIISNGGRPADIIQRYADTQLLFLTDPICKVRTSFFSDYLNWCTSTRKFTTSGQT